MAVLGACLAVPAPVRAEALSLELGGGDLRSHGDALFLSWRRPASPLFDRESYTEYALGVWSGPERNEAFTLSRGVRLDLGRHVLAAGLGIGYVAERTENLDTHLQFLARIALGRALGHYELSLVQRHFSNGQRLFGWSGRNRGENFLSVELARRF